MAELLTTCEDEPLIDLSYRDLGLFKRTSTPPCPPSIDWPSPKGPTREVCCMEYSRRHRTCETLMRSPSCQFEYINVEDGQLEQIVQPAVHPSIS